MQSLFRWPVGPSCLTFCCALISLLVACDSFASTNLQQRGVKLLNMAITLPTKDKKLEFGWLGKLAFSLLPLSPESVGRRKTILTEVVPGKVWTLDQVKTTALTALSLS